MPARHSFAMPATFVGALGARARGSSRGKARFPRIRRRRHHPVLDLSVASELAGRMRGLVPTGRRRKRLVRRVTRRLDRISEMANGAATIVGIAAAGAELVSTLRSREPDGRAEDGADTTDVTDLTQAEVTDLRETEMTDISETTDETEEEETGEEETESRNGRQAHGDQDEDDEDGRTRRAVAHRESSRNGSSRGGKGRRSKQRASADDDIESEDESEEEPEEDAYDDSEEEFQNAR